MPIDGNQVDEVSMEIRLFHLWISLFSQNVCLYFYERSQNMVERFHYIILSVGEKLQFTITVINEN